MQTRGSATYLAEALLDEHVPICTVLKNRKKTRSTSTRGTIVYVVLMCSIACVHVADVHNLDVSFMRKPQHYPLHGANANAASMFFVLLSLTS